MEENVTILKIGTDEAVKSVNDLKENIKLLKKDIGELEIGTEEYQSKLKELSQNQNALKDAMYATAGTMTDVAAAALGASNSYNSLVNQMASLKKEWRATNDEARRNELGQQIAEINQQLKDMDASVGNFQRNVGNYESGVSGLVAKFDQWGGVMKDMPPTLGAAKESMSRVGETMQLMSKNPILAIIGLLAPMIAKITESLKGNETAMGAVKKLMDALQPIFDIFSLAIEKVAGGLSKLVGWFTDLVGGEGGLLQKMVSKASGVGNAILQHLLAPIKTTITAFKGLGKIIKAIFDGEFSKVKDYAAETWEGIKEVNKNAFSFKENFKKGEEKGAEFIEGVKSDKVQEKAKEAGKELGKKVAEGIKEEYEGFVEDDPWAEWEAGEAKKKESKEKDDALFAQLAAEMDAKEAAAQRQIDIEKAVTEATEAEIKAREQAKREEAKAFIANTMEVANATSGLLSSIADMYESDEKNAEKNAKKIKALRIASATIDMLNGAVTAFSSGMQLGPVVGPIVGGINAAAVIAMGVANINQIKSTSTSGSEGGSASVSPAVVSPPNVDTGLQSVRNVTTASEEERLNRMASSQKVYILQSDIEAAGNQSKAQVSESSF